jgi:competence protein ComEC
MSRVSLVLPGCLAGTAIGVLLADPANPPPAALGPLITWAVVGSLVILGISALQRGPGRWASITFLCGALGVGIAVGAWRAAGASLPTGPGTLAGLVAGGAAGEHAVRGTVIDDPRAREDRQQVVLDRLTVDGHAIRGRLAAWLPRAIEVRAADLVAFEARLEAPEAFDGFDYRAYLARLGVGAIGRAYAAEVLHPTGATPATLLAGLRSTLLGGLDAIVPEPEAALGAGILLGVRTAIDPAVNDAFAAAGLTHVVAISGWNIAIVAAIVARLLDGLAGRVGGRLLAPALTVTAIGGYVVLVGSSPSVVRAALMALALLLSRQGGSRAHAASALMLAALVMLVVAPAVLWDVGFQLSLLATAGLIVFGAGFAERLERWPGWVREPVALTLAAQLTTLPVILLTFARLSLVAPVANVVVTPLVPLAMLACAIAAPLGALTAGVHPPLIGDALAWLAGGAAWLGLRAMIVAGTVAASVPFASLPVSLPPTVALAWYPGLALAWGLRRRARSDAPSVVPVALSGPGSGRRLSSALTRWLSVALAPLRLATRAVGTPLRATAVLVAVLGATTLATLPDGRLHLVMLDVGQGDAILVVAPSGATMLVDGGPDPDVTLRRLGATLPWWQRTIDVVLLTHPHQDHVGGLPAVVERFRVRIVLDGGRAYPNPAYARLLALVASEHRIGYRLARAGSVVPLDRQTTVALLYPSAADAAAPLPAGDVNNASVVGLLRLGDFAALLTGDAEAPVEALLAAREEIAPVDVLKVGHHGSHSGTTPAFVAALHPALGMVSVGAGNEYGHPSPDTLEVLADAGVAVLRTDLVGSIEVRSDGSTWTVTAAGHTGPAHRTMGGISRGAARARDPRRRPAGVEVIMAATTSARGAGSIGAWQSRIATRLSESSASSGSRPASSGTRRAWPGSRSPPRAWSPPRGSRSRWAWSRRQRCSMTSTSPRRDGPAARTVRSAPACSRQWGLASWRPPSPRTLPTACSTRTGTLEAGSRCWSAWPTSTSSRRS